MRLRGQPVSRQVSGSKQAQGKAIARSNQTGFEALLAYRSPISFSKRSITSSLISLRWAASTAARSRLLACAKSFSFWSFAL